MSDIHQTYDVEFQTRDIFLKSISIQALKRAYLSSFFYLAYMTQVSEDIVQSSVAGHLEKVIHAVTDTIEWIFEDLSSARCTLFHSSKCNISYSINSDLFEVFEKSELIYSTKSAEELFLYIKNSDINFKIIHYNFKPFLLKLSAFLFGSTLSTFKGVKDAFE